MLLRGTFGKNMLLAVMLVGLVSFMDRAGNPPLSHAMMAAMTQEGRGLQSGKAMPSSCPMKGTLPCCHGKDRVALCAASFCDLCFLSTQGAGTHVSLVRVQPPAVRIIPESPPEPLGSLRDTQSLHPPFPPRLSFSPSINRPLLI